MSSTKEWLEIMAGFRGLRLEVHDDIAEGRPLVLSVSPIQEAVGWLVFNRLVWHDGNRYVARAPREAHQLWASEGPAKADAADVARRPVDYADEMKKAAEAAPPIPPEIREKMDRDRLAAQAHRARPVQEDLFG